MPQLVVGWKLCSFVVSIPGKVKILLMCKDINFDLLLSDVNRGQIVEGPALRNLLWIRSEQILGRKNDSDVVNSGYNNV